MAETIRKRRSSSFYLSKDTFDSVPIPAVNHLELVAIVRKNGRIVFGVVDEKQHVVELIASVKLV
jgi:hypothetical protein